jgi:hypothetical protein
LGIGGRIEIFMVTGLVRLPVRCGFEFGEITALVGFRGYGGFILHLETCRFIECKMFLGNERVRLANPLSSVEEGSTGVWRAWHAAWLLYDMQFIRCFSLNEFSGPSA